MLALSEEIIGRCSSSSLSSHPCFRAAEALQSVFTLRQKLTQCATLTSLQISNPDLQHRRRKVRPVAQLPLGLPRRQVVATLLGESLRWWSLLVVNGEGRYTPPFALSVILRLTDFFRLAARVKFDATRPAHRASIVFDGKMSASTTLYQSGVVPTNAQERDKDLAKNGLSMALCLSRRSRRRAPMRLLKSPPPLVEACDSLALRAGVRGSRWLFTNPMVVPVWRWGCPRNPLTWASNST